MNMETHTNNNAYAKRNPTAIILTEMAFILVSGLEMTVSRCEIIISRFAITISHPEINFIMPSGINPFAAAIKPHNSTTNPRNSTTIPRATSRPGVITPMPLPCPTAMGMAVSWLSTPPAPAATPTVLAKPLRGERKNGGGCNKIGHKYNKSGTDCVNNVYYII